MRELVEDLSIDMEQVIARCKSLLRTITNVRDSYRAVMDTRLNETIRLPTVITVALTIPTMLVGIYGMNVPLPFERSPVAFWRIIGFGAIAFASDTSAHNEAVADFIDSLGFDPLSIGNLDSSQPLEAGQSAFGANLTLPELADLIKK